MYNYVADGTSLLPWKCSCGKMKNAITPVTARQLRVAAGVKRSQLRRILRQTRNSWILSALQYSTHWQCRWSY